MARATRSSRKAAPKEDTVEESDEALTQADADLQSSTAELEGGTTTTRRRKGGNRYTPAANSELAGLLSEIAKAQGEGVAFCADELPPRPHIPTGVFLLDLALLGGIPEGLITLIYGKESSGKSMLCALIAAEYQRKYPDKIVFWVDMETTFDPDWAAKLGVQIDRLFVAQPITGEKGVDVMMGAMSTLEVGLVIGDSLAAFIPNRIVESSAEDDTRSELARLLGKLCSKTIHAMLAERDRGHHVTTLWVNQLRDGMVPTNPHATKLPGGRQQHYTATTKIRMKNDEKMGAGDFKGYVSHNEHTFAIEKAKIGSSLRGGQFTVVINPEEPDFKGYRQGEVYDIPVVVTYAKKMGFISGGGSKWTLSGVDQSFRKAEEIERYLRDSPNTLADVKRSIIAKQREDKGLPALPPDGFLVAWTPQQVRRRKSVKAA